MDGERGKRMDARQVDVLVIGDGVVGRSIAFALADSPQRPTVAMVGRPGPAASSAAGAMLSVLGELTGNSLRTPAARCRVGLAQQSAALWPGWRDRVRSRAGGRVSDDGYGAGCFVLANTASSELDDESMSVMESFAADNGIPAHRVDPHDIPSYQPFDRDRASHALHLPDEGYLDARAWLANLTAALTALDNATLFQSDQLQPTPTDHGFEVDLGTVRVHADQVVVAAGAWTPGLVAALAPEVDVVPVLAAAGAGVRIRSTPPVNAVVRTPNRAFACGTHLVPQADGGVYLGGTNNVGFAPADAPTMANLHSLIDAAVHQFHHGLAAAEVVQTHFGNRPVALDGHPLLGATSRPGLWVATGTFREGIHISPLIAERVASGVLTGDSGLPDQFRPDRPLIADWDLDSAIAEATRHVHALTVEADMRPPITGRWPDWLEEMYQRALREAYATLPDGFVLPPELAPLAYERGAELADLLKPFSTAV